MVPRITDHCKHQEQTRQRNEHVLSHPIAAVTLITLITHVTHVTHKSVEDEYTHTVAIEKARMVMTPRIAATKGSRNKEREHQRMSR